jgi:hypothetical protein
MLSAFAAQRQTPTPLRRTSPGRWDKHARPYGGQVLGEGTVTSAAAADGFERGGTATARQRGAGGSATVGAVGIGRPSRTRADQKCPHAQAYQAMVIVLPVSGGTWRCPHEGQSIASVCSCLPPVMPRRGATAVPPAAARKIASHGPCPREVAKVSRDRREKPPCSRPWPCRARTSRSDTGSGRD